MRLLRVFILVAVLLSFRSGLAEPLGNLRIGGIFGIGASGAQSNNTTRTEGPMAVGAFMDYTLDSRMTVGVEHNRSFNSGSSAIGFSGLTGKWYFLTPQPQIWKNPNDEITRSYFLQKNYAPYLGIASGFGQASIPKNASSNGDVLVASPYVAFKFGCEYPLSGRWGGRGEFNYAMTMAGAGAAEMMHLWFGVYYFL